LKTCFPRRLFIMPQKHPLATAHQTMDGSKGGSVWKPLMPPDRFNIYALVALLFLSTSEETSVRT
jgi:hypothetical protein